MEKQKCRIWVVKDGSYKSRCSRKPIKDGYCWQHYEIAKRKENEQRWVSLKISKKHQRELNNDPWKKLEKAKERIKELEEEIGILKSQLAICSYDSKKHKSYVKEQKRQINRGAVK